MFNNGLLLYGFGAGPGAPITGSGTANTVALFTGTATLGNSVITQNAAATLVTIAAAMSVTTGGLARLTVNAATSSGTTNSFLFSPPTHTASTASSEVNNYVFTGGSRQWDTGALATQRNTWFTSPTLSFVAASTVTNAYTVFISSPTAGTNATITNSWAAGFSGGLQGTSIGTGAGTWSFTGRLSSTTQVALYISDAGTAASSSNHVLLVGNTNNVYLNAPSTSQGVHIGVSANAHMRWNGQTITGTPLAATSGAISAWTFTAAANTGQTASTEIKGILWTTTSRQWATGAITTQREFVITSPTYSFVGASIITTAATMAIAGAPVAGTNATITTSLALWIQAGTFRFDGDIVSGTKTINTTAGDSATINATCGRFRKDTSGTVFTLTNSYITANSIIQLTPANAAIDATATSWTISAGAGSATITFNAAPTANFDMNFDIIN